MHTPITTPEHSPPIASVADDSVSAPLAPAPPATPLLAAANIRKTYRLGRVLVPVLRGVGVRIEQGEWVAVLGASGSGKSTLLHLLGGLDKPDRSGGPAPSLTFRGREIAGMTGGERDRYRSREVGFVFQFYHLLPELTVAENVLISAMVRHGPGYAARAAECRERAARLLDAFSLSHRLRHRPAELSGGERQRVAIARALINEPALLLADEPTGNLDRQTGAKIMDVLASIRAERGQTTLMVTHDESIAARADRVIRLTDGLVAG